MRLRLEDDAQIRTAQGPQAQGREGKEAAGGRGGMRNAKHVKGPLMQLCKEHNPTRSACPSNRLFLVHGIQKEKAGGIRSRG